MAPLYFHIAPGLHRAASATLTLPAVRSNKSWYCNWIMLVGSAPSVSHQIFVQIGLIRLSDTDPLLRVFVASQGDAQSVTYEQFGTTTEGVHRFVIAQDGDTFALLMDGKPVKLLNMPILAEAPHAYVEIGPEVYGEGDTLSGSVLYAAIGDGADWTALRSAKACRYENHGTVLLRGDDRWSASGKFDRTLPSRFLGFCGDI